MALHGPLLIPGAASLSLLVPSGQVVFDLVMVAAMDVLRGTSASVRLAPVRVALVRSSRSWRRRERPMARCRQAWDFQA
jgi:hypothetical protein